MALDPGHGVVKISTRAPTCTSKLGVSPRFATRVGALVNRSLLRNDGDQKGESISKSLRADLLLSKLVVGPIMLLPTNVVQEGPAVITPTTQGFALDRLIRKS
jgi:hypothetical protein